MCLVFDKRSRELLQTYVKLLNYADYGKDVFYKSEEGKSDETNQRVEGYGDKAEMQ